MDVYGSCPPPPLHCSFLRALRLRWLHLPGRAPFRVLGLPRDWSALFTVPHCVCILTVALRTRGNDSNAEVLQLRRCEFCILRIRVPTRKRAPFDVFAQHVDLLFLPLAFSWSCCTTHKSNTAKMCFVSFCCLSLLLVFLTFVRFVYDSCGSLAIVPCAFARMSCARFWS